MGVVYELILSSHFLGRWWLEVGSSSRLVKYSLVGWWWSVCYHWEKWTIGLYLVIAKSVLEWGEK